MLSWNILPGFPERIWRPFLWSAVLAADFCVKVRAGALARTGFSGSIPTGEALRPAAFPFEVIHQSQWK